MQSQTLKAFDGEGWSQFPYKYIVKKHSKNIVRITCPKSDCRTENRTQVFYLKTPR